MGKPKQQKPKRGRRAGATTVDAKVQGGDISGGAVSLHQLFEQQTRRMLDRTDLDEEQKQNLLVAMSCPCCGAGAMSYTIKLKR
jgi:hypothetical protein